MKKIIQRLTRKTIILSITGVVIFCIGFILMCISNRMVTKQNAQNVAERWSKQKNVSQVSCFFSREAGISEDMLYSFEHNLDKALEEASIVSESDNESARLWIDAYSANGKVSLRSDRATMEVNSIGIGGDFFFFHPVHLLYGSYFSGNDVNKDYIIIDEDAAWQLFGSNNVVGKIITINDIPHMITGIIKRDQDKMSIKAGLNTSVAYVSYNTLDNYGTNYGINTYELVMPNPVSGYARNYVQEKIGMDENEVEIVENTTRYHIIHKFNILLGFGSRSMSNKAIIYPYWENIARGYEDITGLLFLFMLLCYLYPLGLVIIALVILWKHKKWTVKEVYLFVQDKLQRKIEKLRANRKNRKATDVKVMKKEKSVKKEALKKHKEEHNEKEI